MSTLEKNLKCIFQPFQLDERFFLQNNQFEEKLYESRNLPIKVVGFLLSSFLSLCGSYSCVFTQKRDKCKKNQGHQDKEVFVASTESKKVKNTNTIP